MNALELKEWLNCRSISSEAIAGELRYMHPSKETSVLLLRNSARHDLIPVRSPKLAFYEGFSGASIGNGHIVIATNIVGGADVSHGFIVPDLNEMHNQAQRLGMPLKTDDVVFMQTAGWMFVFAIDSRGIICRFDRDMKKVKEVSSIESVLDDWWSIVLEDPL